MQNVFSQAPGLFMQSQLAPYQTAAGLYGQMMGARAQYGDPTFVTDQVVSSPGVGQQLLGGALGMGGALLGGALGGPMGAMAGAQVGGMFGGGMGGQGQTMQPQVIQGGQYGMYSPNPILGLPSPMLAPTPGGPLDAYSQNYGLI